MGQEFFINSQKLEDQVRKLLPSQGGQGAGVDLSASTQIIPIIDLTESAEGSGLRQDLQSSLGFKDITSFFVTGATTTIINNTGYFRIFGAWSSNTNTDIKFSITDGSSTKDIINFKHTNGSSVTFGRYDFMVFMSAGDSVIASMPSTSSILSGCTRQIASIDGTLTDPT